MNDRVNFNVRPILSALLRNRTGAILVALQVALSLAVLVNAAYVIVQRVQFVNRPDGMATPDIVTIGSTGYTTGFDYQATLRADLEWLNSHPDVVAAAPMRNVPLSGGGSSTSVYTEPNQKGKEEPANYYETDHHSVDALGVKLIAGRNFRADEILPPSSGSETVNQVIITQKLANLLFPGQNAVGKVIYDGLSQPSTIVGIVEHMHGAWVSWDRLDQVMLMARLPQGPATRYLVRAKPGRLDTLVRDLPDGLSKMNPDRVVGTPRTLSWLRQRSYLSDRNMAIFLVVVGTILAVVTALGIFSLATFNVNARQRQVGTRRAIGARRADILRYFLVENGLITAGGVLLGCALALGLGLWLSSAYELKRLSLYYLVGGVLAVFLLGQIAAMQPARRAARIAPAIATRNV